MGIAVINWLPKLAIFMSLGMALAGCETAGTPSSGAACGIFSPISWSKKDTRDTASQIREHNAAGKAACGW